METVKYLSDFFSLISDDPRIGPMHICMYGALLVLWQKQEFQSPISVFSREVMLISKVSGLATYHRCIRELHEYGYIKYLPSYNHFLGSLVYLLPLKSKTESCRN